MICRLCAMIVSSVAHSRQIIGDHGYRMEGATLQALSQMYRKIKPRNAAGQPVLKLDTRGRR